MSNMLLDNKVLNILEEFSSDYNKRIYGRDIAKRLKMNQKTVSNILNKLEKENILKFSYEGKNKYYYLNRFNPSIKEVVKLVEIDRKIRFIARNKNLRELFEKLEEKTQGILIVFGSYARGEDTSKSDIDIAIVTRMESSLDLKRFEKQINRKINIYEVRIKECKKEFINNLANGIVLYGFLKVI